MMNEYKDVTWIDWFCSLKGNEFFCKVPLDFIIDQNELFGIRHQIPHYDEALDTLLNTDFEDLTGLKLQVTEPSKMLYGLIHARYIVSDHGILEMIKKYETAQFGRCPRVYCKNQPMLPIGLSDILTEEMVKLYCPKCCELYKPTSLKHSLLDGAYFGSNFQQMLFMSHPEKCPNRCPPYIPRLFGFRIQN